MVLDERIKLSDRSPIMALPTVLSGIPVGLRMVRSSISPADEYSLNTAKMLSKAFAPSPVSSTACAKSRVTIPSQLELAPPTSCRRDRCHKVPIGQAISCEDLVAFEKGVVQA